MNPFSLFTFNRISLFSLLVLTILGSGFIGLSQEISPKDLIGNWQVDLRPSPGSDPYYTDLNITEVKDNTFKGSYYGSPIKHGNINTSWGKLHFAFVTSDGSTTYHSTGQLIDGKLVGTTHALERDFLSVWTGEK